MASWKDDADERPEWDSREAGPEFHLNQKVPPRCPACFMPMRVYVRENEVMILRCSYCSHEETL
ncbi:MAG TPA: hypothetical protein VK531_12385 [Gemmatimonadales bacterium]|nr:hypothetical protein [Gemmatimonadales bacterium]